MPVGGIVGEMAAGMVVVVLRESIGESASEVLEMFAWSVCPLVVGRPGVTVHKGQMMCKLDKNQGILVLARGRHQTQRNLKKTYQGAENGHVPRWPGKISSPSQFSAITQHRGRQFIPVPFGRCHHGRHRRTVWRPESQQGSRRSGVVPFLTSVDKTGVSMEPTVWIQEHAIRPSEPRATFILTLWDLSRVDTT